MKSIVRLTLVAAGVLLSIGSAAVQRGPDYAKLDPAQARSISLSLVGNATTFCPGNPPQLKVVVITADNHRYETWSAADPVRDGKLLFTAFEWSFSAGGISPEGIYEPPADPLAMLDKPVVVSARVAGNPGVITEFTMEPTFVCGAQVLVSGEPGREGEYGPPGRGGRPGDSGNAERRATDGERGGSGGDGRDGGNGGSAAPVEVSLGYIQSQKFGPLVLARVTRMDAPGASRYYVIDPRGQPLLVVAQGGDGGGGGRGGEGGEGGFGGSNDIEGGSDGGAGGDGGDGGRGGGGGDGGDGGAVLVRFDRAQPELQQLIRVENAGGRAGYAGSGGNGGNAGPGGSSASGRRGETGRGGIGGQAGVRTGREGRPGAPPVFRGEPREAIFAAEIERGWPLVAPSVPRGG
jgi:hypothetical protein